ncbi:hypothetical protein ACLK1S_02400 [Escherichia coli]
MKQSTIALATIVTVYPGAKAGAPEMPVLENRLLRATSWTAVPAV